VVFPSGFSSFLVPPLPPPPSPLYRFGSPLAHWSHGTLFTGPPSSVSYPSFPLTSSYFCSLFFSTFPLFIRLFKAEVTPRYTLYYSVIASPSSLPLQLTMFSSVLFFFFPCCWIFVLFWFFLGIFLSFSFFYFLLAFPLPFGLPSHFPKDSCSGQLEWALDVTSLLLLSHSSGFSVPTFFFLPPWNFSDWAWLPIRRPCYFILSFTFLPALSLLPLLAALSLMSFFPRMIFEVCSSPTPNQRNKYRT